MFGLSGRDASCLVSEEACSSASAAADEPDEAEAEWDLLLLPSATDIRDAPDALLSHTSSPHSSSSSSSSSRPCRALTSPLLWLVCLFALTVGAIYHWSTSPPQSSTSPPPSLSRPDASSIERGEWQWPTIATVPLSLAYNRSRVSPNVVPAPPVPSIAWILRCYSGYWWQLHYLYRSMEQFLPPHVLNDVVLVLDNSTTDHSYASSLPSWVKVRYEDRPPLSATWVASRRKLPYDEALYSNWLMDLYSDAEILCALDPDMMFNARTSLYTLLYWDADGHIYRPLVQCLGPNGTLTGNYVDSHLLFNVSRGGLPHVPYCMSQLPVCILRSTLLNMRQSLSAVKRASHPDLFAKYRNVDEFAVAYSVLRETFVHVPSEPICQFCVWSTYIMSEPTELRRYVVSIGAAASSPAAAIVDFNAHQPYNVSMCHYPRSSVHVIYTAGLSRQDLGGYAGFANDAILEGLCRGVQPDDEDCLTPLCVTKGWTAVTEHRSVMRWETQPIWYSGQQERACQEALYRDYHRLLEWQWQWFDTSSSRQRVCGLSQHVVHSAAA